MKGLLLVAVLAACAGPEGRAPDGPLFVMHAEGVDPAVASSIAGELEGGRARVETFFGEPFVGPVDVFLCKDRATFDASFPPAWGVGATECWMVGTGVGGWLSLLSPTAWAAQACDHDPSDIDELRGLLAHELTHCFHGEHSPKPDFTGVEGLDWFVEGLATLVSGQLVRQHAGVASRAVEAGTAPARLADAWTGRDRYGVSGSLVEYIGVRWGQPMLSRLLSATNEAELLARLGVTEADLLRDWTGWVKAGSPR